MPEFSLSRFLRTASSEVYYIHSHRRRRKDGTNPAVAVLHLHLHGKLFMGALLLLARLKPSQVDELQQQIETLVDHAESRDDFMLGIFQAEEVGDYSDIITEERRRWEPPVRKDLEDLDTRLRQVVGKHQVARGLLNEHALIEFLQSQGFEASKADSASDHDGIDVIATKAGIVVYAQAKLGEADNRALSKLAAAVAARPATSETRRIGLLAGDRFPPNLEFLRIGLEAEYGVSLACVEKSAVLRVSKKYRHALE